MSRAGAMVLDDMPKELRPVVQVIDDWVTNRKLGLLVEARVGKGKLLICSIDLRKEAQENIVARQMLASLLQYASSDRFKPVVTIAPAQVRQLIAEPSAALKSDSSMRIRPGGKMLKSRVTLKVPGAPKSGAVTVIGAVYSSFPLSL